MASFPRSRCMIKGERGADNSCFQFLVSRSRPYINHEILDFMPDAMIRQGMSEIYLVFLFCLFMTEKETERESTQERDGGGSRGTGRRRFPAEEGAPYGTRSWDAWIMS